MACADVTSANVVGYTQVVIPAQQQTMIGVQFQDVSGASLSIQDLFPDPLGQGLSGADAIADAGLADQLVYWDGGLTGEYGHYIQLYLNNTTRTAPAHSDRSKKWCLMNVFPAGSDYEKEWGEYNKASTAKVRPGMGFWLVRAKYAEPITLTMAGQVTVAKTGLEIPLRRGQNMFTLGFTTPFAPNPDIAGTGAAIDWLGKGCAGADAIADAGLADQMVFWDASLNGEYGHYIQLYLNNTTRTAPAHSDRSKKWCLMNVFPAGSAFETAWGEYNKASPVVIPAGRGVWYIRNSDDFVLKLDQPYTL